MSHITQIDTQYATVLQKDNVTIIIDKRRISKFKQNIIDIKNGAEFDSGDTEMDAKTYTNEIKRLINIAERIAEHKNIDIFEYLPLTKAGRLNRTKNILIADSSISNTHNGDYFAKKSLQLRLEWFYINSDIKTIIGENTDAITLRIDWYDASKKMEPIFDREGNPHVIKQVRTTYLKNSDLIPGHVYVEKSGTSYLYLGKMSLTCETFFSKNGKRPAGILPTEGFYMRNYTTDYAYLRWTKKLQDLIAQATDFNSFVEAMTAMDRGAMWVEKASCRANPRKFIAELCTAFDGTIVHEQTIRSKDFGAYTPGDYVTYQYYIQ